MTTMKRGLIAMPRTHTGSVAVTHRVDASFKPCFLSYSRRQGARTTSRCGSRRLGIVSIHPYRAHTAEEPVGDGPRGRCYGPVNPNRVEHDQGGKGVNKERGEVGRSLLLERGGGSTCNGAVRGAHRQPPPSGPPTARSRPCDFSMSPPLYKSGGTKDRAA